MVKNKYITALKFLFASLRLCVKTIAIFIFLQIISPSFLSAQVKFERRVIIEQDSFYAVEINRATQIGKLYIGNIRQPIDSAMVYALPAGARQRNLNPQPFAWTLHNDSIYCINATEYAMNSHVNSLKAIPLKNLLPYDSTENPTKLLMQAALANCRIKNMPLMETYKKYTYVDDMYYDILLFKGAVHELIAVKDELTVWHYSNGVWTSSDILPLRFTGPISVFALDDEMHILNDRGDELTYPGLKYLLSGITAEPTDMLLVEDRDNNTYAFVPAAWFSDTELTVKEILKKTK